MKVALKNLPLWGKNKDFHSLIFCFLIDFDSSEHIYPLRLNLYKKYQSPVTDNTYLLCAELCTDVFAVTEVILNFRKTACSTQLHIRTGKGEDGDWNNF